MCRLIAPDAGSSGRTGAFGGDGRNAPEGADDSERKAQDRRFEQKFNALVRAIEAFSKKYNEGNGQLWPQHEAAILRKALLELQKVPEIQASKEAVR